MRALTDELILTSSPLINRP